MKSVCDFCYSPDPVWEYKIPEGAISGDLGNWTTLVDDGRWFACEDCAKLIENGDAVRLVNRAMENNPTSARVKRMSPEWLMATAKTAAIVAFFLRLREKGRIPAEGVK